MMPSPWCHVVLLVFLFDCGASCAPVIEKEHQGDVGNKGTALGSHKDSHEMRDPGVRCAFGRGTSQGSVSHDDAVKRTGNLEERKNFKLNGKMESDDISKNRSIWQPVTSENETGFHQTVALKDVLDGISLSECKNASRTLFSSSSRGQMRKAKAKKRSIGNGNTNINTKNPTRLPALVQFLEEYILNYGYTQATLITLSQDEQLKRDWIQLIQKILTVYSEMIPINSSSSLPFSSPCRPSKVLQPLTVMKLSIISPMEETLKKQWTTRSRECAWLLLAESPLELDGLDHVSLPLDNQITIAVWPGIEVTEETEKKDFKGQEPPKVELWDAYQAWHTLPALKRKVGQWFLKTFVGDRVGLHPSRVRQRESLTQGLRQSQTTSEKTHISVISSEENERAHLLDINALFQDKPQRQSALKDHIISIQNERDLLTALSRDTKPFPRQYTSLVEIREAEWAASWVTYFPPLDISFRRRNLTGLHLRCVTESWMPFSENKRLSNGTLMIGGILQDVFDQMSSMLNFTYTCRQPDDHEFGVLNNGTWSGMIGELVAGRADIAVSAVDNTYLRAQYIDFCAALDTLRYTVFMRQPYPNAWANYTRELSFGSWMTLLAAGVGAGLALRIILQHGRHSLGQLTLTDALFTVFSMMVNQGSWKFTGLSTRLLLFTVVLTAWMSLVFYTSNLISALAIPSILPPFTDLHGLLEKKTHKLGLQTGLSEVDRFRMSMDPLLRRVWKEIISQDPENLVPTADKAIEKVLREKFVFVMEEGYFDVTYKSDCRLYKLPTKLFNYGSSMAFPKNSTLTKIFSDVLMELRSAGFLDHSKKRRYSSSFQPCDTSVSTQPMGIDSIFTAFILISGGLTLALLLLGIEVALRGLSIVNLL